MIKSIISWDMILFITTAVKTSNPTTNNVLTNNGRSRKETILACLKIISRHSPEKTEKYRKEGNSGQPLSGRDSSRLL
jgi:hypothetical protein